MKPIEQELTAEVKLNTLVKSIYTESQEMGFKSTDYVKLMNELLDLTIKKKEGDIQSNMKNNSTSISVGDLPIKTKNLVIRYYNSEKDKKYVSKWFKDENNKLFWLSTISKNRLNIDHLEDQKDNLFAIISLKNNTPIGILALLDIDRGNSKAEMRKMIGEVNYRGKGFAKEATDVWLKFCTEFLELNKIYINTIETNVKNVSLNRQLGLKLEGLLKKECKIDNVEHDVLRMAYFKR